VPQESLRPGRLGPSTRRIVARFASVVCPPDAQSGARTDQLLDEFELQLGVLPTAVGRLVPAAFVLFDRGAHLYPGARGRRFTRLGPQQADAYLRAVLARRRGGLGAAVRQLKGLVVLCYYELPEVKEQLGYRPEPYIADVSRRRLVSYGAEILAGEAAVLAPGPQPRVADARPDALGGRP
jgi:hypothetical protein